MGDSQTPSTYNQANMKMVFDQKRRALTVSLVTGCSVWRPRRQGCAPPRTQCAPLTAPGARHDHLVTSETVRVKHDVNKTKTHVQNFGLTSNNHIEGAVYQGVNELESSDIPLLEKEGWLRHE